MNKLEASNKGESIVYRLRVVLLSLMAVAILSGCGKELWEDEQPNRLVAIVALSNTEPNRVLYHYIDRRSIRQANEEVVVSLRGEYSHKDGPFIGFQRVVAFKCGNRKFRDIKSESVLSNGIQLQGTLSSGEVLANTILESTYDYACKSYMGRSYFELMHGLSEPLMGWSPLPCGTCNIQ